MNIHVCKERSLRSLRQQLNIIIHIKLKHEILPNLRSAAGRLVTYNYHNSIHLSKICMNQNISFKSRPSIHSYAMKSFP